MTRVLAVNGSFLKCDINGQSDDTQVQVVLVHLGSAALNAL